MTIHEIANELAGKIEDVISTYIIAVQSLCPKDTDMEFFTTTFLTEMYKSMQQTFDAQKKAMEDAVNSGEFQEKVKEILAKNLN